MDMIFSFKMDAPMKAVLEKKSLELGITQGEISRRALIMYLLSEVEITDEEKQYLERAMQKRNRIMMMDLPKDLHDGGMMIDTIATSIEKEIAVLKKRNMLCQSDYDHFIKIVEENKEPCSKYEDGEWVCEKLDMLIDWLKDEKIKMEKRRRK